MASMSRYDWCEARTRSRLRPAGQRRLQDQHHKCHLVCKEGHHESDRAYGAHQGTVKYPSDPSTARSNPFPRAPGRKPTKTCSSAPCRKFWCYAASITTPTTGRTIRIRFTPRTKVSTSSPCTGLETFPTEFRQQPLHHELPQPVHFDR